MTAPAPTAGARRGGRRFVVGAIAVLAVVVWLLVRAVTEDAPDTGTPSAPAAAAGPSTAPSHRGRAAGEAADTADVAPDEAPAAAVPEEPPDPGTRRVRVVDQDGVPVVGLVVAWTEGAKRRSRPTDARGIVEVPVDADDLPVEASDDDVPEDAPRGPARPGAVLVFDGAAERKVEVGWPGTDVVVSGLPLLDVVVVDGTTGAPVSPKGARVTTWVGEDVMQADLSASQLAARHRLPLSADRVVDLRVDVDPPAGYVALRSWSCESPVAPGARIARVVVPVFPATSRTLLAVDDSGRPVAGARVVAAALLRTAGDEMASTGGADWTATPDDGGRLVVAGLPAAPRNTLRIDVQAENAGDRFDLVGHAECPADAGGTDALRVELRRGLRRDPVERQPGTGYVASASGSAGPRELVEASAPLALRVVRRDGAPAAGVHVVLSPEFYWYLRNRENADPVRRITDAEGRIRFDEAPRTTLDVVAWGAGFTATRTRVDVAAGGEPVLREAPPREVRVVVVDPDGRPVRCARVTARASTVATLAESFPEIRGTAVLSQLRDDVDLLTPRTGADGAVALTVPSGAVRYTAALAGAASVTVSDEALVRIVLGPKDE